MATCVVINRCTETVLLLLLPSLLYPERFLVVCDVSGSSPSARFLLLLLLALKNRGERKTRAETRRAHGFSLQCSLRSCAYISQNTKLGVILGTKPLHSQVVFVFFPPVKCKLLRRSFTVMPGNVTWYTDFAANLSLSALDFHTELFLLVHAFILL